MAERAEYIYDLSRKLNVILETLKETGEIEAATFKVLADYCNIKTSSNIKAGRLRWSNTHDKMSEEVQRALASACRFSTDDPTWIDKNLSSDYRRERRQHYEGRDTARNFLRVLRKAWGLEKNTKIALKTSSRRIHRSGLADFSLDNAGQEAPVDSDIALLMEVDAQPGDHEGVCSFGFREIKISVEFSPGSQIRCSDRLGLGDGVEIRSATLTGRGVAEAPWWALAVKEGVLNDRFATVEDPLCKVTSWTLGEALLAKLWVYIGDTSVAKVDGTTIPSKVKRAIIASLLVEAMEPGVFDTGDGTLLMGEQVIEICRGDEN